MSRGDSDSDYEMSAGEMEGSEESEYMPSENEAPRKKRTLSSISPSKSRSTSSTTAASADASFARPASMRFASTGETAQGTLQQLHQSSDLPSTSGLTLLRSLSDPVTSNASGSLSAGGSIRPQGALVCDFAGCNKSFSKVGKLNRHKLSHSDSKSFHCSYPECGKSFTRNDRLRRHWKIHQNNDPSLANLTSFPSTATTTAVPIRAQQLQSINQHDTDVNDQHLAAMSESDVEIAPTAVLRRTTDDSSSLQLVNSSPAPAAATSSTATTAAIPALPSLPPLQKFPCTFPNCSSSFLLREHLKRHELSVHGPASASGATRKHYPCIHVGCFLVFDKAHKLREHSYVHTGILPWICTCSLLDAQPASDASSSASPSPLPSGIHEEEEKEIDSELDEDEDKKQQQFAAAAAAAAAVAATSASASSVSPSIKPLQPSTSSPRLTSIQFAQASNICKAGFMTRAQLLKHQRLEHGPKRFICKESDCGASFHRFLLLRKHQLEMHPHSSSASAVSSSSNLECEECGMKFTSKTHKNIHLQTHLSLEEREAFLLPCPFSDPPHSCTKKFTRRGNLNQHIRNTHDADYAGAASSTTAGAEVEETVSRSQSPAAGGGTLVVRFPCPFQMCATKMAAKPYKEKATLRKHLCSFHSMTPQQARDDAFINEAVAKEHLNPAPPMRPHHSSRRKKSIIAQICGVPSPLPGSDDASAATSGLKRKRSDEQESKEEATPTSPPPIDATAVAMAAAAATGVAVASKPSTHVHQGGDEDDEPSAKRKKNESTIDPSSNESASAVVVHG